VPASFQRGRHGRPEEGRECVTRPPAADGAFSGPAFPRNNSTSPRGFSTSSGTATCWPRRRVRQGGITDRSCLSGQITALRDGRSSTSSKSLAGQVQSSSREKKGFEVGVVGVGNAAWRDAFGHHPALWWLILGFAFQWPIRTPPAGARRSHQLPRAAAGSIKPRSNRRALGLVGWDLLGAGRKLKSSGSQFDVSTDWRGLATRRAISWQPSGEVKRRLVKSRMTSICFEVADRAYFLGKSDTSTRRSACRHTDGHWILAAPSARRLRPGGR